MGKTKIVRLTMDEALVAAKLTPAQEAHQDDPTEADIDRAIAEDPDAPDFGAPALARHLRPIPAPDVRLVRARLAMTQVDFARALGVPVATIRD